MKILKRTKKKDIKIFLLGIVKINDFCYKLLYIPEFKLFNNNYKGYFIDEKITENDILFSILKKDDFNKWFNVRFDVDDNLLCLYYKEKCLNL